MAADRFIYCLEQITDYIQFERLCHDLMAAEGYTNIEPLGGSQDKGRDAIHVDRGNPDDVTIFAYSVREDWKVKLKSDCRTIHGHGHACRHLVFLCTELFTPDERDKAVNDIKSHYGWQLELYGLERLRVLLSTIRTQIVANHPSIFCPPFFPQAGGLSAVASPDYLVVDYAAPDEALATWLSRRLTLAGYQVWCRSLAPIAGASLGDTIQTLLGSRAFRFLAILSPASLNDPDLCARRSLAALTRDGILLPIAAASFDESRLDTKTRSLEILHFADSWATGLARLLDVLSAAQCPRSPGGGIGIALRSFMPSSVVSLDPETVVSNQFRVLEIPKNLHRFKSDEPVDLNTVNQASLQWAFRRVDPQHFLSFHQPPDDLRASLCLQTEGEQWWAPCETIDGIAVRNLIPELVRKSLIVACIKKGLCFCPNRKHLYFPAGLLPAERLKLTRPNGTRSFIHVSGQRKFWRPQGSKLYKYHLAPVFFAVRTRRGSYLVHLRIRLRLTDKEGVPLEGKTILSRRKHLCKSWWNDEWLNRTLAVMQFLADGASINIGEPHDNRLCVSPVPDQWTVPVRINEDMLSGQDAIRDDAISYGHDTDEPDDE